MKTKTVNIYEPGDRLRIALEVNVDGDGDLMLGYACVGRLVGDDSGFDVEFSSEGLGGLTVELIR